MSEVPPAIRWAPRVSRTLMRRLYERDARGIVDEELIDEVAFAFYARCQSIVTATEAYRGRAACPRCETVIPHSHRSDEVLHCPNCAWRATWREYRQSYQGKYLVTGNPGGAFTEYPRRVKAARSPRERMLAVDWLIQQVHSLGRPRGRPVAVNLIEGAEAKVMEFLDQLFVGLASSPEEREAYAAWRKGLFLNSER